MTNELLESMDLSVAEMKQLLDESGLVAAENSIVAVASAVISRICEISLSDPDRAVMLLLSLPRPLPDSIRILRLAAMEFCFANERAKAASLEPTEFDVHKAFWSKLGSIIPGAKRAKGPSLTGLIPDGWIDLQGEVIPLEIKKGYFGHRALIQLRCYMQEAGLERGVAVGRAFRCKLPPGVIGITIDQFAPDMFRLVGAA